jgi:spore coat protein A, manganese oxidase
MIIVLVLGLIFLLGFHIAMNCALSTVDHKADGDTAKKGLATDTLVKTSSEIEPQMLEPIMIPKFTNEISNPPPVYIPTVVAGKTTVHNYTIEAAEFEQQILPPPFPKTKVLGYGGMAKDAISGVKLGFVRNAPGPSFEAVKGIPINVHWINNITSPCMFPVDPTIHWADPNEISMNKLDMHMVHTLTLDTNSSDMRSTEEDNKSSIINYNDTDVQYPVPMVPHLHGGEVQSTSDGGPEAWFTADGKHGPTYNTYASTQPNAAVYHYPNEQPATTLWYHDHALGLTRINVLPGLAGFYLLRDENDSIAQLLPTGKHEMPLVIQDRIFKENGSLYFPSDSEVPNEHPCWKPEFFGNVIIVNGKAWPNMNVDRGQYRFRILDGSNARFYNLSFSNGMSFTQIGSDGGYLQAPVPLKSLLIAPGERADILVDFSNLDPGTKIILINNANAPFPDGDSCDPESVGQIMQFTTTKDAGYSPVALPAILNPALATFPSLTSPNKTRILTLTEVKDEGDHPLELLLDGQNWAAPISEQPALGTTEDWIVVNPTDDTHPIHLHLVQFQLISRQKFEAEKYLDDWKKLNGEPPLKGPTKQLDLTKYLEGEIVGPEPNERGWKDTIQMNHDEATKIRMRFAPIDGRTNYSFDATEGPGYVWHCHILDHEDNEMMRPYKVVPRSSND